MKCGVGFPSFGPNAAWAAQFGAWDADYPAANAGRLIEPSRVARAAGGQIVAISAVLAEAAPVQFFAVVNHNLPVGAVIQIQGYSTTDPNGGAAGIVYESGPVQVWPSGGPVAGYRSIRPVVLPAPVSMRSFRIIFFDNGQTTEVGGIEVSGFWEWPGLSYGRELGFRALGSEVDLIGGSKHRPQSISARTINASIDLMAIAETATRGLDFQVGTSVQQPFVWAQDYDDASTWARTCLLVRNEEVPPMVGRLYRHDAFPVRLVEHMR